MWKYFGLLTVLGCVSGIRLGENTVMRAAPDYYECPAKNSVRPDAALEIYTTSRMPGEPWTVLNVEVAKDYNEFMCGIQNRQLPSKCNCGYMFKWRDPETVLFFFRSVSFDSEVYFLDKRKQIITYQEIPAYSKNVVYSPVGTRYALVTQSGISSSLGVQIGDPISVSLPDWMYEGEGVSDSDDKVGMHT